MVMLMFNPMRYVSDCGLWILRCLSHSFIYFQITGMTALTMFPLEDPRLLQQEIINIKSLIMALRGVLLVRNIFCFTLHETFFQLG